MKWEHTDDGDSVDEAEDTLKQMLPICKEILEQWDLFVNEDKTDFIYFQIAQEQRILEIENLFKQCILDYTIE